jgi:ApaG protein
MSTTVTKGIRVTVESRYVAEQSNPRSHRFVFAYTIEIANVGDRAAQLASRHWVITDAAGHVEEVRGPGVVGETPRLLPGQMFQYTSGCVLRTARGTMHGSYQMVRDDDEEFDADIPLFTLVAPTPDRDRLMN